MRIYEFIYKIPYSFAWKLANSGNYSFTVIFYCTSFGDYELFDPIRMNLGELNIVSKDTNLQNLLFEKGISSIVEPVYPKVLITVQDTKFKFPSKNIVKIRIQRDYKLDNGFYELHAHAGYDLFIAMASIDDEITFQIGKIINDFIIDHGISF